LQAARGCGRWCGRAAAGGCECGAGGRGGGHLALPPDVLMWGMPARTSARRRPHDGSAVGSACGAGADWAGLALRRSRVKGARGGMAACLNQVPEVLRSLPTNARAQSVGKDPGKRVGHRGCSALQEIFAASGSGIAPGEQPRVIATIEWDGINEKALYGAFQQIQKGEALAMSCLRVAVSAWNWGPIDVYCCARGTHSLGTCIM
jgi:hypothetical protein